MKEGKRIVMSTNFSSPIKSKQSKKSKWGNYVDIYETSVQPILIAICTRMDKPEGSYITPMVRAFYDAEQEGLPDKWNILCFLSRRGLDSNAKQGVGRNAMTKGGESTYEWEAIVAFVDREKQTVEEVGKNIAQEFTTFSKNDKQVSIY